MMRIVTALKDAAEAFNSQPVVIKVDSAGIAVDTISVTAGMSYKAYGSIGTIYGFSAISTPSGLQVNCPSSGIIYDTISATSYAPAAKHMGLSCTGTPGFDFSVNVAIHTPAMNDNGGDIYVQNSLCTPTNGTLTLHYSPKYNGAPTDIHPAAASVTGNTIVWNLTALSASSYLTHLFYIARKGSSFPPVGDTVHSYFTVDPVAGDADPASNIVVIIDTVKGSWDPNDIQVKPAGCIASGAAPVELKYTIRFENTGNDTAHNIYVMDTLPANVDISSMRIVMSSHEMYVSHLKDAAGHNILKFDFPAIKLLDSSYHGLCDGAIIFTVNTKAGLPQGTVIPNRAGIYFDDNPVVLTNTAMNVIGCPTGVDEVEHTSKVAVYPNPVGDVLTIEATNNQYETCVVSNSIGQVLIQSQLNSGQTKVDVKVLPAGMYYITLKGAGGSVVKKFVKM